MLLKPLHFWHRANKYISAWSPAINFWKGLSELYPDVTIVEQYFKEGNGFIGEAVMHRKLNDKCVDITPDMQERAGAVLDDEGYVDWDATEEYDLFELFPLS